MNKNSNQTETTTTTTTTKKKKKPLTNFVRRAKLGVRFQFSCRERNDESVKQWKRKQIEIEIEMRK
jgi:hypothetical protein